jgi:hypothetical protein
VSASPFDVSAHADPPAASKSESASQTANERANERADAGADERADAGAETTPSRRLIATSPSRGP